MTRTILKEREFSPEEIKVMELIGELLIELEKLGYIKGETADEIAKRFLKEKENDL
ncbi:MAG: hypothetical protein GXO00_01025 [Candidatus Diapherotrites archaeon]|nr:hypothetical protein [Candidatus Diapherotrites archaeon]